MSESAKPLLTVNNVEVIYDHVILVLKGVSLRVPQGGIVALLGANGAGKSTTLKAISGLLRTERGEVTKGVVDFLGQRDFAERQAHADVGHGGREEVHRRRSDEARDEQVGRPVVQFLWRADLLCLPGEQDHHAVPQRRGNAGRGMMNVGAEEAPLRRGS